MSVEPDSFSSRVQDGIKEAKEIWSDAILPERVEAEKRLRAFDPDSMEQLSDLLIDTPDDERIADNRKYIAAALSLLRKAGIDERTV